MRLTAFLAILAACWVVGCSDARDRSSSDAAERFAGKLEACEWAGVQGEVRCGTLAVPEDRSVEGGRSIDLRVVVLPATGDSGPAADALTFLAGGGVAPATRYVPFFANAVSRLREGRDIVLVDQRGTGGSNALECDLPEPHEVEGAGDASGYAEAYVAALRACRIETIERADPVQYTTWNAADDLNAVREWLGYEQLSLWGASYGTKVARVFMRRHPDRVRAVVLHGVVPIERSMWPDLFLAADSALAELTDLCAADPSCGAAFPDLETRFAGLVERLDSDPVMLRVPLDDVPADTIAVPFDRRSLAGLVAGMLRSSRAARALPSLVYRLSDGDYAEVTAMQRPGAPPPVPRGVYLSIACTEELARLTESDLERAHRPTRLGSGEWIDEEIRDCAIWGSGTVPDGFWTAVESEAPVLLVTGSEDYITPPGYADWVAGRLPNGSVRVVPQRGHDDMDPCVAGLIENFLILGRDTEPDLGCLEDREALPFVLPG
ncbi:MAG: alpha/beta hydrolase [Gemmatimonadetes bacterium]|nr:alpha/beta hydrolase [Gemmatimonadota bacterium]